MKLKYIVFYGLSLFYLNSMAQQLTKSGRILDPAIHELRVGDQVPDIPIPKIINDEKSSAKLSDFKDQLLILDFWDTGCGVCIESMPKLDSLQKKFGNKIKILLVNWQQQNIVEQFFKNNRFLKERPTPVKPPSIVEDKTLSSYFRYSFVPHTVWIYKGKVLAITRHEFIRGSYIQQVLNNESIKLPVKNDAINPNAPIISLNNPEQYAPGIKLITYSVLTPQRSDMSTPGGWIYKPDSVKNTTRLAMFNSTLIDMCDRLLFNSDSIPKLFFKTPARLVLEMKHPEKYVFDPLTSDQQDWESKHQFCYEMVVPGLVPAYKMAQLAIKDIATKIGLIARWEKRKVKCLVAINAPEKKVPDNAAMPKKVQAIPMKVLLGFHLDWKNKYPPAIDETNFKGNIAIGEYDGTLEGLRKELQKQGFDLIEAYREIDVMLITDTNP